MSALINQATVMTHDMLVDLVRNPGSRISEDDATTLGLDVEMLDALYEADVRPYLDNVLGYRDLADIDPLNGSYRWKGKTPNVHQTEWSDVLSKHKLMSGARSKYRQTARVFQSEFPGDLLNSKRAVTIYLAREGAWIVWHVDVTPQHEPVGDETVRVFSSLKQMFDYLREALSNHHTYRQHGRARYIPLQLAYGLMRLSKETIDKKREYLDSFEKAHADGMARIATIAPSTS